MKYEKLRLREQEIFPSQEVLEKILGESFNAYKTFQDTLEQFELEQLWQFYPCFCGKAWMARGSFKWTTPRGANKEKNIYWLSAWEGYFKVAIWFKEKNRMEILKSDLSEGTKRIIRDAKTMGKLMTFPVEFDVDNIEPLADIYELIRHKKELET